MNTRTDIRPFAQLDQDRLILAYLNQKRNGKFLDIGCSTPLLNSSTFLLEKEFDWSGVAIDIEKQTDTTDWNSRPHTELIICDALSINYEELCDKYFTDQEIDFLSLDLEPPEITFEILKKFPFHKWKPKIIAYETDSYRDGGEQRDYETISFMQNLGYSLRAKLYPRLEHLFLSECGCQDHIYVRADVLILETNR
jgi:hypothetical protein